MSSYGMVVTIKGVKIVRGWIQDGLIVKRGQEELEIGQTVKYESGVEGYTGEWKVLGADELGNLLVMSAVNINKEYPLYSGSLTDAQNAWLSEGVKKLDDECKLYGKGVGAISARSIRIEDIDKVPGYDKTTYGTEKIYVYVTLLPYLYIFSVP